MAFRSRTRAFRRPRGPKVNVTWATPLIFLDQLPVAGATLSGVILTQSDFNTVLTFERIRLERIKGWLAFSAVNSASRGGVIASIFKLKTGLAPDPTLSASYDANDLLWSGGAASGTASTSPGSANTYLNIDVKARRLMDVEDDITICVRAVATGSSMTMSGVLRALWSYK